MTKRETRVINAFINCVKSGEFTPDYAITLIEDNQRYGWLSEEAKEVFYTFLGSLGAPVSEPAPAPAAPGGMDEEEPAEGDGASTEAAEPATEGAQDGDGE